MSIAASSWNEVWMDFGSGGAHVFLDLVSDEWIFFVASPHDPKTWFNGLSQSL